jgi:hypothetical protein
MQYGGSQHYAAYNTCCYKRSKADLIAEELLLKNYPNATDLKPGFEECLELGYNFKTCMTIAGDFQLTAFKTT